MRVGFVVLVMVVGRTKAKPIASIAKVNVGATLAVAHLG